MIVDAAKSVRIEHEIARRGGLNLKRIGGELIGPCPKCGGRDRYSISLTKQVFNCRACNAGGDIIAFVQRADGVDFRTAIRVLAGFTPEMTGREVVRLTPQEPGTDFADLTREAAHG
jgi:DNA primase